MNGYPLTKIPNVLIKKFRCSQCRCYLSIAPIGVRTDGQTICGRCINWTDPRTVVITRCKIYEELGSLHTFPCSYQTQGCLEYFPFNKAFEHETRCPYRTYRCPVNFHSVCHWDGTLTQISQHYKTQHPELYLKTPNYKINHNEDYEINNLIEIDNVVLLLQVKCAGYRQKLCFNAVCIGDEGTELMIQYKIKLSDEDNRRVMELEDKKPLPVTNIRMIFAKSDEVDIKGLLALLQYPKFIQCEWYFTIAENLKNQPDNGLLKNLEKCPNCDVSMIPPIYRCPVGHVTCTDCKGYNEKCGICCKTNLELTRAIDLENAAHLAEFPCKWNNCNKIFDCTKIREHEQECPERIYKCPECENPIGLHNKIFQHFKTEHRNIPFEMAQSDILKISDKILFTYVLVHKEIFKINIIKDASAKWTVNIIFYGPPGLSSYFKYEVRDHYNVLYYPAKCFNNLYKVTQATDCTNNIRSEYYLSVKFNKQTRADVWVPIDWQSKRVRIN